MDKRQIYIITILIILGLLAGLAIWYAYIVRQDAQLTQTKNIDTPSLTLPPAVATNTTQTPSANTNTNITSTEIPNPTDTPAKLAPEDNWTLHNISSEPVLTINKNGNYTIYTDAKLGTIHQYDTTDNSSADLSIETLPDLRDVYILDDSYMLVIPKFDRAYITDIPQEKIADTNDNTAKPTYNTIYDDLSQVTLTKNALYYISQDTNSITIKKILFKDLNKDPIPSTKIWDSHIKGWVLSSNGTDIYITQKASSNIPGYAYKLSPSGQLSKLVGDKPALITNLSPDGKKLLYSTVDEGGMSLYIKDLSTNKTTSLYSKTLASKCAWVDDSIGLYCATPNNLSFVKDLPDSWYKGISHLSDDLWYIDTKTGEAAELMPYLGLDIVDTLTISSDAIVFKDKTTGSLWSIIKTK